VRDAHSWVLIHLADAFAIAAVALDRVPAFFATLG
jgi:hypothetical protein